MREEKNKELHILMLVIGVILYMALLLIMGPLSSDHSRTYNGVLAQFQVVISAVLVTSNHKRGFITSCALNFMSAVNPMIEIITGTSSNGVGILIPMISMLTMTIIYVYLNQAEVQKAEISDQYEKIIDANRLLHEKDEALRALVYTDRLTGMKNMQYFYEEADNLAHQKKPFSIIYIDIDNFKGVNDMFGPRTGDTALRIYAERLNTFCGSQYTCARISGDEFGVLLAGEHIESEILNITEQLRDMFSKRITAQMTSIAVTVSCGVVLYPRDGNNAEVLIDNAIIAVYTAKANGKDRACFFS